MLKWLNVNKNGKRGEMYLYGDIVTEKWYDTDVAPKSVKEEIDKLQDAEEIDIYINSPGGEVFAGMAIYNMLSRISAKKIVHVDGIAASIASVIALAGNEVHIPQNGMFMIHNPWTIAVGDSNEFRKIADSMDKVKESILSVYQSKTGTSIEELSDLMDNETWMTGDEAVAFGFADYSNEPVAMAASVDKIRTSEILSRFVNKPDFDKMVKDSQCHTAEESVVGSSERANDETLKLMEAYAC